MPETMSENTDRGALTTNISLNFIKISLVYFLVGAIWMGLGPWLPEPWSSGTYETSLATAVYDSTRVHVMVLGWASFALIGAIYYLVPRAVGRPLHSVKLARVHFWVTNIALPLGIAAETYATFVVGSLMQSGTPFDTAMGSVSIAPFLLVYLVSFLAGLVAQFIFVYNIFKTTRR